MSCFRQVPPKNGIDSFFTRETYEKYSSQPSFGDLLMKKHEELYGPLPSKKKGKNKKAKIPESVETEILREEASYEQQPDFESGEENKKNDCNVDGEKFENVQTVDETSNKIEHNISESADGGIINTSKGSLDNVSKSPPKQSIMGNIPQNSETKTEGIMKSESPPRKQTAASKKSGDIKDGELLSKRFIPYHNPRYPYPRPSLLTKAEQKKYLELFRKFSKNITALPTPDQAREMNQFKDLQMKVGMEQQEFLQYLEVVAHKSLNHYSTINPEAKKYVEEHLDQQKQRVTGYPKYYIQHNIASLQGSGGKKILEHEKCLLEMGKVVKVLLPNVAHFPKVPVDYDKVNRRFPVVDQEKRKESQVFKSQVCSQDPNAASLCQKYPVDVVVSSSGLKCIINNQGPMLQSRQWEIPVIVKEVQSKEEDKETKRKVVFIDKPFIQKQMSAREKNQLYYKLALKTILQHPNHKNSFKLGSYTNKKKEKQDKKGKKDKLGNSEDFFDTTGTDNLETFGIGTDIENKFEKTVASKKNNDASPDKGSVTVTVSEAVSVSKADLKVTDSTKSKEEHCGNLSSFSESDMEDKLVIDISSPKHGNQSTSSSDERKATTEKKSEPVLGSVSESVNDSPARMTRSRKLATKRKSNEMIQESVVATKRVTRSSGKALPNTEINNISVVKDSKEEKAKDTQKMKMEAIVKVEPLSTTQIERKEEIKPAKQPKIEKVSQNEQKKEAVGSSPFDQIFQAQANMLKKPEVNIPAQTQLPDIQSTLPLVNPESMKKLASDARQMCENPSEYSQPTGPTKNVSYNLWKLGNLRVLTRCGIDGHVRNYRSDHIENHKVMIVPKLEYQPNFGYEQVTIGETANMWSLSTFRHDVKIVRARINFLNSEIMMLDELGHNDILFPRCQFNPDVATAVLHDVFETLTQLSPGTYLLGHSAGNTHAHIKKNVETKRGVYDLHSAYLMELSLQTPNPSSQVQWVPVDPCIELPSHKKYDRVPCTFEPKDAVNQQHVPQPTTKKKKKKKKRKKKN